MDCESKNSAILLVEDQWNDVVLMGLALESAGVRNPMIVVYDGAEAITYLSGAGQYSNRANYPFPALILLDLKMPKIDGFGVLEWLQARPEFDDVAVVVQSSSNLDSDIARARALGADDYLVKPNDHEELVKMVRILCERWLDVRPMVNEALAHLRLAHVKARGMTDEWKAGTSRFSSGTL